VGNCSPKKFNRANYTIEFTGRQLLMHGIDDDCENIFNDYVHNMRIDKEVTFRTDKPHALLIYEIIERFAEEYKESHTFQYLERDPGRSTYSAFYFKEKIFRKEMLARYR
jgi:hypothetical protein